MLSLCLASWCTALVNQAGHAALFAPRQVAGQVRQEGARTQRRNHVGDSCQVRAISG